MQTGIPMSSLIEGVGSHNLGKCALVLAMTESKSEEEECKKALAARGLRCVATEAGGGSERDFQEKMTKAVIGAALNTGLVEKEARSVHALIHAAEEAKRGVFVNTSSAVNVALKIAIVRNQEWVAIALYGESSLHLFSCHERVGLGMMHLP